MKITLDIKENTINTVLSHAAKRNKVNKKDVTDDMFMLELARMQRFELFRQVSQEFYTARTAAKREYKAEQLKVLMNQATIQKDIQEGYLLQVEGNAQYVYRNAKGIELRISYDIEPFVLLNQLGVNTNELTFYDDVDQGDGTELIKLVFNINLIKMAFDLERW